MYQQQELYSHQQEALARLQDEAERLRQEKLEAMGAMGAMANAIWMVFVVVIDQ